jgi:hypothetical protein
MSTEIKISVVLPTITTSMRWLTRVRLLALVFRLEVHRSSKLH